MSRCLLLGGLAASALLSRRAATADPVKVAVGQRGAWHTSICAFGDRVGSFQEAGVTLELLFTDGGAETQQAIDLKRMPWPVSIEQQAKLMPAT